VAARSEVTGCSRADAARNSSTTSQNSCGACSNIQWRVPGITAVLAPGICSASTCQMTDSAPFVSPPPISSVGVLIDSASLLANGLRFSPSWPISVLTLSRNCCFAAAGRRAQEPSPSMPSTNNASAPSLSPAPIFSAAIGIRAPIGVKPDAAPSGRSAGSRSPPGSASTSFRSNSGRACATRNPICPPREWPIRSTGPVSSFSRKLITSSTCCAIR
jgi:hypothetical protein